MKIKIQRTYVWAALIALILVALLATNGGVKGALSYRCRAAGESLGLSWAWSLNGGCWVQEPNGQWVPLDQTRFTP
ncbi:MAG: hypothetical protein M5U11_14675 [Anaerolineales bacterium]|jgi:hypothetical protein|nr:hypothetical protein [Anaerolineales bacterium]MDX9935786.1 hypothetical protein [Anaerolineales bacterium]GER79706.1 hypothetical protein DIM_17870 [Candidatus Denitrolinea symbiosum]HPP63277.1 hypothetical protein [Anaerolineales bacterium]